MLYYFRIGGHRYFIVDFSHELIIGERFLPIARPEMRRLTLNQPKVISNYLQNAEHLIQHYKIKYKIDNLKNE